MYSNVSIFCRDSCSSLHPQAAHFLKHGEDSPEGLTAVNSLPEFIDSWVDTFLSWGPEHKTAALDAIVAS